MEDRSLEELLADLRLWLDYVPDAVFVVAPGGRIALANCHAARMFQHPADWLIGQPIESLIPERFRADHERHRQQYEQALRVRPMGSGLELTALRGDSSEFPVEISLGPLPLAEGAAVFALVRDLTDRRRLDAELREYHAQTLAARAIQQQLLPACPLELEGYDIAGALRPAVPTGGDHFDFLRLPDGCLGVVLSDVAGQGIGPVQFSAAMHARLRRLAETTCDLEEILQGANAALSTETSPPCFVTVYLGRLDPAEKTWLYSSAGHTACYALDARGGIKARMEATSIPLAILSGARYPISDPVALEAGDMLLLLTNGILESRDADGRRFGVDRCLRLVHENREQPANEILQQLLDTVADFTPEENPVDDLTSVLIKVGV